MVADRGGDGLAMGVDRQAVVEFRNRQRRAARAQPRGGGLDPGAQLFQTALHRLAIARALEQAAQAAAERGAIPNRTIRQPCL